MEDDLIRADLLSKALASLTPRLRKIIEQRFGFEGHPMTLREIGLEQNVCGARVAQLEQTAFRRMRSAMWKLGEKVAYGGYYAK